MDSETTVEITWPCQACTFWDGWRCGQRTGLPASQSRESAEWPKSWDHSKLKAKDLFRQKDKSKYLLTHQLQMLLWKYTRKCVYPSGVLLLHCHFMLKHFVNSAFLTPGRWREQLLVSKCKRPTAHLWSPGGQSTNEGESAQQLLYGTYRFFSWHLLFLSLHGRGEEPFVSWTCLYLLFFIVNKSHNLPPKLSHSHKNGKELSTELSGLIKISLKILPSGTRLTLGLHCWIPSTTLSIL